MTQMHDPIFSPVLEAVMVPKETYNTIYQFTESHVDHRTYIPNATFVDYKSSVAMLEKFLQDEVEALSRRKLDDDTISLATQKFINESADLWKSEPIYHNRILKYMESAYQVPEKVKTIYERMVMEHPSNTDAIKYGITKYLEAYMDHVSREMDYLNNYVSGSRCIPLQESIDTDFHGYYMPEGLGNTIARIPGMILMLMKKLLNKLNYALVEAGRAFSNNILKNNAINEEAIKQIYTVYQAKSKQGSQKPIKYPDPKTINELRQTYATGFQQFEQQMIEAIQKKNFRVVDTGVIQIIQKFQVVKSNLTLQANASFQEFRTAILSIANNIIILSDFMQCLKHIDDFITQESGIDPKKLDKALDAQTKINRDVSQQNQEKAATESVEEDQEFNGLFVMNEKGNPHVDDTSKYVIGKDGKPYISNNSKKPILIENSLFELDKNNRIKYDSNGKPIMKTKSSGKNHATGNTKGKTPNDHYYVRWKDGKELKIDGNPVLLKDSPYKLDENGMIEVDEHNSPIGIGVGDQIKHGLSKALDGKPEEIAYTILSKIINILGGNLLDHILGMFSNMLTGGLDQMFSSVDNSNTSGLYMSEEGGLQPSEPAPAEDGDQTPQGEDPQVGIIQKVMAWAGINDTGGNSSLFNFDNIKKIAEKAINTPIDAVVNKVYDVILGMLQGKDESNQDQNPKETSKTASAKKSRPTQAAQPQTASYNPEEDSILDMTVMQEAGGVQGVVDTVRGAADTIRGGASILKGIRAFNDIKGMVSNTAGFLKNFDSMQGFNQNVTKMGTYLLAHFQGIKLIGHIQRFNEMNKKEPGSGAKQMEIEKEQIKKEIKNVVTIVLGAAVVTVGIVLFTDGGKEKLQHTIEEIKLGKLPPPQRAAANISDTKQALAKQGVPPEIVQLSNSANQNIKNLWRYINGWLYGGLSTGGKYKTVGIADIIDQEFQSLAPYVNMRNVVDVDLSGAINAGRPG